MKTHLKHYLCITLSVLTITSLFADEPKTLRLENEGCLIEFDAATGELLKLENRKLGDQLLKANARPGIPFQAFSGFKTAWLPTTNNDVEATIKLGTGSLQLISSKLDKTQAGNSLTLNYAGWGFDCVLTIYLPKDSGDSVWNLSVKNVANPTQELLVEFPVLDGLQLGAADAKMQQTILNQVGMIGDAWTQPLRVYANTLEWSMQWHSVFEPKSRSALGLIVMDPNVTGKRLSEVKPVLKVTYFGPISIPQGASHAMPPTLVKVYSGDWKPTARDFAVWSAKAWKPFPMPEWVKELDTVNGIHFKKAGPGVVPDHGGHWVLDNFSEIPKANIRIPVNLTEYAFYSRGSMIFGKHTDGVNEIREDLGGVEAIREGIAAARKLGLRTCMYVEGFIIPFQSELAADGRPERWQVINADGGTQGPYTDQGFYQMCPGVEEWQDYLAEMCARVMRETGADGLRLDSLGFWSMNCFNPGHKHESPYDYNQWMKTLLEKVGKAVREVKPDAMFWAEGSVDFFSSYCNTGFTQHAFYVDDVPPMRIAMKGYRPFALTTSGVVWPSLAGLPGGRSQWERDFATDEANWFCAQFAIHDTLVWGDVLENPAKSDPEIRTRHFTSDSSDLIVAARPENKTSVWGDFGKLSSERKPYDVYLPVTAVASQSAALCNIETLEWKPAKLETKDGQLVIPGVSNWMLAVFPKPDHSVVSFDALAQAKSGDEIEVSTQTIAGAASKAALEVYAPGLTISKSDSFRAGDSFKITVPQDTLPGLYEVSLKGEKVLGVKRYLKVVP